jgi:hypothetical protein
MTEAPEQTLAALLRRRLELIADRAFVERDAAGHLAALREISEAIDATFLASRPMLKPRLRHFMEQASYSKALEFIESEGTRE